MIKKGNFSPIFLMKSLAILYLVEKETFYSSSFFILIIHISYDYLTEMLPIIAF